MTTPASYLVNARDPPPSSSPASTCVRPRLCRMDRISPGVTSRVGVDVRPPLRVLRRPVTIMDHCRRTERYMSSIIPSALPGRACGERRWPSLSSRTSGVRYRGARRLLPNKRRDRACRAVAAGEGRRASSGLRVLVGARVMTAPTRRLEGSSWRGNRAVAIDTFGRRAASPECHGPRSSPGLQGGVHPEIGGHGALRESRGRLAVAATVPMLSLARPLQGCSVAPGRPRSACRRPTARAPCGSPAAGGRE